MTVQNRTNTEPEAPAGLAEEEFFDLLQELSPQHKVFRLEGVWSSSNSKLTPFQQEQVDAGRAEDLVLGQYVLEDRLGEGGMGVVYRAVHMGMDRQVALKVLSPELIQDEVSIRRFFQEVRTLSRLSHPNIVTAYDASHSNHRHFLVMEYVDGVDLDALVTCCGPLSIADTLHIGIQISEALEFVHRRGIIHRDIKPSNVLVGRDGYVKVLDLGLAKLESQLEQCAVLGGASRITQPGVLMGTVDFLSPEQARDTQSATSISDIYSLGCTLYFLLTGKPPYEGETILDRLIAHRNDPVPSIRTVRRDAPRAVDRLLRQMLAKEPADRPADMRTVRDALTQIVRDCRTQQDTLADLVNACQTQASRKTAAEQVETADDAESPFTQTVIIPHEEKTDRHPVRNLLDWIPVPRNDKAVLRFTDWLLLAAVIISCLALMAR
jgi:eukaryotic-like serine/threonine-protein kinase